MVNDEKEKIWERLLAGLKSAIHLQVVTYVGDVEVRGKICEPEVEFPKGKEPHKAIVTCIDLIQGDITSCFPDEYTTEERSWVRDYHDEQVSQGKEIVERNLRLIAELGEQIAKAIAELKRVET